MDTNDEPSSGATADGWPSSAGWPSAYDPRRQPNGQPLPTSPLGSDQGPGRGGWPVVIAVCCAVLVVAGIAAAFIRLPYDTIAPGDVRQVSDLLAVDGHPVFPAEGEVLFVTVATRQGINPYEALQGWLDSTIDVFPQERIRGDLSREEYRQLNVEAMADSKTAAEIVALTELGFTDLGAGAEIVEVDPELPAAAVLQAGDVLVEVDGAPVASAGDAVEAIQARAPGDTVSLRFLRGEGPPQAGEATLATGEDGGPLLGVRLTTRIELPFEIAIDSGNIVGPSAGLSYALSLVDLLSEGELTGGAPVAATGDLAADGSVRAVGGVAQKAVTVRRAGAELFIVPEGNEEEAREIVGDSLRIVGVSTFDEALEALASLEGSNARDLPVVAPAA